MVLIIFFSCLLSAIHAKPSCAISNLYLFLPEIAVIAGLALVIFGPKRLPELGRTIGKTLKGLQSASTEFEREIKNAMTEEESANENIVDKEN